MTLSTSGTLTADPQRLLQCERDKWQKEWKASDEPTEEWTYPDKEALGILTPEELRKASLDFSEKTATTADGFHPRHFALLGDCGLQQLSRLYSACEVASRFPPQIRFLLGVLLAKPKGGYRVIVVFAAPFRLYSKSRRGICDVWEEEHDRPYWAMGTSR